MSIKSGQVWTGLVVCKDATGALAAASVGPVGALYVNGVVNAAAVTVSGTNPYKWAATLPTLTAGDLVSMYVTATVATVATAYVVAEAVADTKRVSDLNDPALAAIAAAVWDRLTTALTTVGSVGAYLLAKLGLISSATAITVNSPVAAGTVTTYQGDDYLLEDSRSIDWDISGSPVSFQVGDAVTVTIKDIAAFTGAVVDTNTVRLELTRTQTATITEGSWDYMIRLAAASDSDVFTLGSGSWISVAPYTAPTA